MAWFDNNWVHRREVTVDNTAGSAKTNYAVKIELTSLNFDFTKAQTNGEDVRVTDADETTLIDHWIESWDSVGETATVWAEVPSISAASSQSVYLYYGNAGAADTSSITDTFSLGVDNFQPSDVYGNLTGDWSLFLGNVQAYSNPIVAPAGAGWRANQIREVSNVLLVDGIYYFYVTGRNNTLTESHIGLLTSADGDSWSLHASGQPVQLNGADLRGEDPYVWKLKAGQDDSFPWRMLYETDPNQNINLAKSADGIAWVTTGITNPVLARDTGSTHENTLVGSPTVYYDPAGAGKAHVLYESQGTDGDQTSYASATGTCLSYTKSGNNPIFGLDAVDDIIKIGSTWYVVGHVAGGGSQLWTTASDPDDWPTAVWVNENPATWPDYAQIQYFHETDGTWVDTSRVMYRPTSTNGAYRVDHLTGKTTGALDFNALHATDPTADPLAVIEFGVNASGQFIMAPNPGPSSEIGYALRSISTLGANGFEMMTKVAIEQLSTDNVRNWSVSVGSGSFVPLVGTQEYRPFWDNGYFVTMTNPDAPPPGWELRMLTNTSTLANIDTSTTPVAGDVNTALVHTMSLLSTGALRYTVDGMEHLAGSNSGQANGDKRVLVAVGRASATSVCKATIDWIAVRPYDGVDPTQTVGAEESDFDPANLDASVVGDDVTLTWDASF